MELKYRVEVYRGGAYFGELKAAELPQVTARQDAEIKMSMAGEFAYNPDVDYLNDRLRLIFTKDGAEERIGDFCITGRRDLLTDTGAHHVSLECYDLSYILKSTRTETLLHFSAGGSYLEAIQGLLIAAGLPLVLATPSDAVFATDREDWELGTDYLSIINGLLDEMGYEHIWYNALGFGVLAPAAAPTAAEIDHRYGPGDTLIRVGASQEQDVFDEPNVFIVVCDNPDLGGVLSATAENNNPMSSLSIFRRGRRIAQVYKVDNVASQAELQAWADRLAFESVMRSEVAEVETEPEAGHGIGDIVAANHPLVSGIWRETAWSFTPRGTMRHTWQRMIFA